jgi:glutamyl-tRNA synthetase
MTQRVRTRFAPSPTGFIHLGNIRSALYPWAFARANGGDFILRIEDTDQERSTQAAVDVIIEGMAWLGLDHDEGPFYQMQRMDRYKEVLQQLIAAGHVYPCYMSVEELDALRERQMANKEKPRYDGTWRPEPGKVLPPVPEGVKPVLRFKNPKDGVVAWDDKVKGRIEIANAELDDLVIARPAAPARRGHADLQLLRGGRRHRHGHHPRDPGRRPREQHAAPDQHLPRPGQGAAGLRPPADRAQRAGREDEQAQRRQTRDAVPRRGLPARRHGELPGAPGLEPRRRRDLQPRAVPGVVRPRPPGPQRRAVRRGQAALGQCPAPQGHARRRAGTAGGAAAGPRGIAADERLEAICGLFKDRCDTTVALADWAAAFYADVTPSAEDLAQHVTDAVARPAGAGRALAACDWDKEVHCGRLKDVLAAHGLKMPQLAMPVRVLVMGTPQTPSLDAVLALQGAKKFCSDLQKVLNFCL